MIPEYKKRARPVRLVVNKAVGVQMSLDLVRESRVFLSRQGQVNAGRLHGQGFPRVDIWRISRVPFKYHFNREKEQKRLKSAKLQASK
jgi:hypothetical protein